MLFYHSARATLAVVCLSIALICTSSVASLAQSRPEMPLQAIPVDAGQFRAPSYKMVAVQDSRSASRAEGTQPSAGGLDTSFAPNFDYSNGLAFAVEEQPDGKVVVAGGFKSVNGFSTVNMFRLNADHSLDTSFSVVVTGTIIDILTQPDGKIVIGGSFNSVNGAARYSVARLNADGSLDNGFNAGGGADNLVRDLALQPDGKIIVAGEFFSFNEEFRAGIARLNTDGSVDSTFTSPLMPSTIYGNVLVSSVAVSPDGKLVLGGVMHLSPDQVKWVLRLNPDGAVDIGFTSPSMSSNPWKIAVQPDGKIVAVGFFNTVNTVPRGRIARLNVDGSLDATFDPGTGANSSVLFVRTLASGKVLVSGVFSSVNGSPRGGFAQLNANGSLDTSFAPATGTTGTVYSVIPTSGGKYYVGGSFSRLSGADRNTLALLNSDGSVDTGFEANTLQAASVRAMAVQNDGKILVGGFLNRLNGSTANSLLRLNPNGTLDTTFANGISITGLVTRIVVQPDGRILVLGNAIRVNNGLSTTLARLNSDGSLDGSFTLATIPQIFMGYAAAVQPDGKILYAYGTSAVDPSNNAGFIRLNEDGSIDGSFPFAGRRLESIAVLPNGQIMVAGPFSFAYVDSTTGTNESHNGIIRLNSNGSHDRTFRSGLTTDIGTYSMVYSMLMQPDGKILLSGRLYAAGSSTPVGVVRLNATGTLDGTFQTNTIAAPFGEPSVVSIHQMPDGKIIAGGYFGTYGISDGDNVVRLLSNGLVDQTFYATTNYSLNVVTSQANGSILIGGGFERVNGTPRTALARLLAEPTSVRHTPFDFDGDGKTDIGIFRPSAVAEWWINRSSTGQTFALQFGASTDRIAPADYTGDGKADITFFRPSSGEWYVLRSEDSSFFAFPFGANGDVPVPADYDADGKADFAVFRPLSGTWFISQSGGGGTRIFQFGVTGDVPVVADYDGDNKADAGIFRPSASGGEWWINRSTAGLLAMQFGASTDKPVQGDYTGDGKADIAMWRPASGEWFIVRSEDFSFFAFPFGANGDIPSPGDYDGDGKFDPTVFRPWAATWYIARSTAGTQIVQFGANGDQPIPNAFVP